MECKYVSVWHFYAELIELIDTLWNVNAIVICSHQRHLRINRYIMECKFIHIICILFFIPELIDTLWNVNTIDVSLVVVRTTN